MTDSEKLKQLIETIENTLPYVAATISVGNCIKIPDEKDWVGIHRGRAGTSRQFLEAVMKKAQELK